MEIDRDNTPKELWFIDLKMIRAGQGPKLMVPISWLFHAGSAFFHVKGRRGPSALHSARDCFATEQEAKEYGARMARAELRAEFAKWASLRARLMIAAKACQ